MTRNRLQDDLLQDFREQKQTLQTQIELFDLLAASLSRPAARRLMSKGILILSEVVCYLMGAGTIAFALIMNQVFPFNPLSKIRYITQVRSILYFTDAELFSLGVHGLTILCGVLFLILARGIRRIRLKNDVLDIAGRNIKILMGQHLKRKAAIEVIEQRHFHELPIATDPEISTVSLASDQG